MAAQKLIRSYNHDKIFGEPIKVMMDPSCCTYVVCSFSNKSICIYDFITGEMVVKATGHAEIVTGVILPDCKHIVLPPAYSYPSFCKEERQHSKINPEDVWSMSNKSQSGDGMLYPESSISSSPPEVQIPSDHASPLPDTLNSQDSSSFGGTCRTYSADSTCELIKFPVKENSVDKGSELGEIIMLLSVCCSYFKIRKCSYDKEVATGAVARKVNAVARLVQCRKNSKCESSRLSVQEMDQFGRFAEGRSDRIMETPKDYTSIH
ncbi:hypothetical protein JHK87_050736 [Glycine soja]|nr:hypothetical protein JHK87_050736 [Glycine soja]